MYDTIIFDLDGTLLNTLEDLCDSTNIALTQYGYTERSIDEIRRFVGNGVRKLIERALPSSVSPIEFEQVFTTFKEHYSEHCNDKTGPYEGIMDLLHELNNRGYKLGIASNKMKSAVDTLNQLYFEGLIQGVAGVCEGVEPKPDAFMVNGVMSELKSIRENTLYVGDSQVDVATARNAGLDMVTVLWGFRNMDELEAAGAGNFIEHPMDLLKYLD